MDVNARTARIIRTKSHQSFIGANQYLPSLENFFSICEQNYFLVKKIVDAAGGVESKVKQQFGIALNAEALGIVEISIDEQSRYTTTIIFHQVHPSSEWLPGTFFKVRVYDDAKMVEVLQYQRCDRLAPAYSYPNRKMYQCDEKQQQNKLLFEWLSFCLSHGYRL